MTRTPEEVDPAEVVSRYDRFLNSGLTSLHRFMGIEAAEWKAEGSYLWDTEGNQYLDLLAGFGTLSLGHRPAAVVEAVKAQLDLMPLASRLLFNPAVAEAAAELASVLPGELQKIFFCNSGTEAVEGALKLARLYTGKSIIVATENAFHGKTLGALSASGREAYKKPFCPLVADFVHVPFGDVRSLEAVMRPEVAAFIVEPVQGEGGVNVPPDDYLPKARALCDHNEALLILDEVQTGFGRTGRMFACEHSGVAPDIITLAKALGGGVMPIGAFASTPAIWKVMEKDPYLHTSTLGGNPLACAAATAAIREIKRLDLPARAAALGPGALARLRALQAENGDIIADVRGRGLLIGVEFTDSDIAGLVIAGMIQRRVIAAYALNSPGVVRIEPALTISREDLDRGLDALAESVAQTKAILAQL